MRWNQVRGGRSVGKSFLIKVYKECVEKRCNQCIHVKQNGVSYIQKCIYHTPCDEVITLMNEIIAGYGRT